MAPKNNLIKLIEYILLLICIYVSPAQAQDVTTFIPPKAHIYAPILNKEVNLYFPDMEFKHYFGGLAEQESCISLKHSRCWDPSSQLLTKRERGAGIFQLTKAFKADGSIRFDSLQEMKDKNQKDLKELSWSNILQRPDLQIRAMLLMTKDNYHIFSLVPADEIEKWKMVDASYNAGPGSVKKRRIKCGLTKDCNPEVWDGNLAETIVLSTKPIYGTRSPHFINNEHVEMIFHKRMHKYKTLIN